MGAALSCFSKQSRTKMVARRMAVTTTRARWLLRVINAAYVIRQLENLASQKTEFWISPHSKVSLAGQEKAPAR
jgi:hypothetical protein